MLIKEFLFGNSKFSAFNNDHFVALFLMVGFLTAYYSLYYTGRFYTAYYEMVREYIFFGLTPNPPVLQECNTGQSGACLLLAVICTLFLAVSFVIAIVSFLYKHVLSYLFFSYIFYVALPSIRVQYLCFRGEKTSQQMEELLSKLKAEKK